MSLRKWYMLEKFEEFVTQRWTYNTMAKRKRTKGQTTIYKTQHRKLMIKQHEPH